MNTTRIKLWLANIIAFLAMNPPFAFFGIGFLLMVIICGVIGFRACNRPPELDTPKIEQEKRENEQRGREELSNVLERSNAVTQGVEQRNRETEANTANAVRRKSLNVNGNDLDRMARENQ